MCVAVGASRLYWCVCVCVRSALPRLYVLERIQHCIHGNLASGFKEFAFFVYTKTKKNKMPSE